MGLEGAQGLEGVARECYLLGEDMGILGHSVGQLLFGEHIGRQVFIQGAQHEAYFYLGVHCGAYFY